MKGMASEDHLIVAAIDFGTTYSGYAFSWKHEYKKDPLTIHANQAWNSEGKQLLSLKTPTSLLLDNKKELYSFGYEAENKYAEIVMDEKQNEYYYFHRFKMNLHNNKNISNEMVLKDITGRTVPALEVFTKAIGALKKHFVDHLYSKGTVVTMKEIFWVLTVPAIWSDKAKQFMRNSAEQAGILKEDLLIALEPESASIFCQYLPTEKLGGSDPGFAVSGTGTKYMVVDIGGGTLDLTVHEKLPRGKLKELTSATGNDCGGTSVDDRYFQLLVKIFGGPLLKELKEKQPLAYLDLFREFETVKRTITSTKTGNVNISIPYVALDRLCKQHFAGEELPEVVASSSLSNIVKINSDKLRIAATEIKNLFIPTVNGIIECMKEVFERQASTGVTHVLVVGGFADCKLVQEAIRQNSLDKRVVIPEDPGLVVLKGAVLFGHDPGYIQSRKMQYTYGVLILRKFDETKHDKKYLVMKDGMRKCDKLFDTLVCKDESVKTGTVFTKDFHTIKKNQSNMKFPIYITPKKSAMYTDEKECIHLGTTCIRFSKPIEEKRWVDVSFVFGETELAITAVDRVSKDKVSSTLELV